jgi:hypothetical protein
MQLFARPKALFFFDEGAAEALRRNRSDNPSPPSDTPPRRSHSRREIGLSESVGRSQMESMRQSLGASSAYCERHYGDWLAENRQENCDVTPAPVGPSFGWMAAIKLSELSV